MSDAEEAKEQLEGKGEDANFDNTPAEEEQRKDA